MIATPSALLPLLHIRDAVPASRQDHKSRHPAPVPSRALTIA